MLCRISTAEFRDGCAIVVGERAGAALSVTRAHAIEECRRLGNGQHQRLGKNGFGEACELMPIPGVRSASVRVNELKSIRTPETRSRPSQIAI